MVLTYSNVGKWVTLVGGGITISCVAVLIWKALSPSSKLGEESKKEVEDERSAEEEKQKVLSMASHLKGQANAFFQEGKFDNALQLYEESLTVLSWMGDEEESISQQHIIRSNAVMCFYKLHRYQEACLVATELLEEESLPPNLKAKVLYRRGLSSKALDNKEAACLDFQAAIHFSPGKSNPEAERELRLLTNNNR